MTIHRAIIPLLVATAWVANTAAQDAKNADQDLIAAVQKLNGYTAKEMRNGQPVLNIQFRSPGPNDDDLKTLAPLLKGASIGVSLNLNQCYNITDSALVHIEKIGSIRQLGLGQTKVTDAGFKSLETLENLEDLYASNDKFTDAGLAPLSKLSKLRKLSVYSKGITEAGFKHVAGLSNVEEIHLGDSSRDKADATLEHIKGLTKLRTLSIGTEKLTDVGMSHLKNMAELRELRVEGPKVTAKGIENLASLTKLVKLTIISCPAVNSEAMAAIGGLKDLENLEIIYCGAVKPEASKHLKGLTNLKVLRFESVMDSALEGIETLPKLEYLQLFYARVGDEGLKHVGKIQSLKDLSLMKSEVTDEGLKHLSGLKNVEVLGLSEGRIKGPGLEHLAGCVKLRDLSLSENKVTDASLKHLAKLASLEELSLSGCPITDAGLKELKPMKSLKNLNLTGTKVNDDAVLELKKELTKTRIRDIAGDEVSLEKKAPRPKPKVEDLTNVKPDFTVTADQLFKEYKEDRGAADKKYKNKVIEISGTVSGMGSNIYDETYLSLEANKDLIGVMCVLADGEPWNKGIVPGHKIKLKGKYPEFSIGTALVFCVPIELDKTPPPTVTSEALAKEYLADKEGTLKKYKDKYLVVTGEIVDREFNSVGAASVQFRSGNDVKVKCSFTAFEKAQTKLLKVGGKASILGQFTLNFGDDEVGLYFCHLMKPK